MTNTPIQITTDLSKVLERIDTRLDKIDAKFDKIDAKFETLQKEVSEFRTETKVSLESVRGDIKVLDEKVDGMDKRLEKVETSQLSVVKDIADLKGAKSLIIPIIVAVTTSLLTLLIRSIPNP
jgi:prefoldin subunit 5